MPKRSCGRPVVSLVGVRGGPVAAALRPAQGKIERFGGVIVLAGVGRALVEGHVDVAEPRTLWISMAVSGPRKVGVPSMWFWKWTPSSVILRILASENTW